MDDATRKEALDKLAAFDPRIGHPVKYIDYSIAEGGQGRRPSATRSAPTIFDWKLQLSRFPKPVDRTLWDMTPQTINAYYDPFTNQITFPAAILQPPFFDPAADPAANYGAIGAVIGHEMGHGFDDEGRKFDATGRAPRLVERRPRRRPIRRAPTGWSPSITVQPLPGRQRQRAS